MSDIAESVIQPRGLHCAAPYCDCVISTGRCAALVITEAVIREISAATARMSGLPGLAP